MTWLGRYEGYLRYIAKGMKSGDLDCCERAAQLFCGMLPKGATICPMPSHKGGPTYMEDVCMFIQSYRNDIKLWRGLRFESYESSYELKRLGLQPETPVPYMIETVPVDQVFVLDNVIATGRTASVVEKCGCNFIVLALAKDMRRV